jgi:hypothetical protein
MSRFLSCELSLKEEMKRILQLSHKRAAVAHTGRAHYSSSQSKLLKSDKTRRLFQKLRSVFVKCLKSLNRRQKLLSCENFDSSHVMSVTQKPVIWRIVDVALEQSSLFLTTTDASALACVSHELHGFFEDISTVSKFWDDGHPQLGRGAYCEGLSWLHALLPLERALKFARLSRRLQLRGSVVFARDEEVFSLTRLLQAHSRTDMQLHSMGGANPTRFLATWVFDPVSVAGLLEGSLQEVMSDPVTFTCKHFISFTMKLAVARLSTDSSQLAFYLAPVEMIGNYVNSFELKISASIVAPDAGSSALNLNPMVGGVNTHHAERPESCHAPTLDGQLLRHFTGLTSLVCVRGECASLDGASWICLDL